MSDFHVSVSRYDIGRPSGSMKSWDTDSVGDAGETPLSAPGLGNKRLEIPQYTLLLGETYEHPYPGNNYWLGCRDRQKNNRHLRKLEQGARQPPTPPLHRILSSRPPSLQIVPQARRGVKGGRPTNERSECPPWAILLASNQISCILEIWQTQDQPHSPF